MDHRKLVMIWTDELANEHWCSFVMKRLWEGHSLLAETIVDRWQDHPRW
jgi:hypothetical protein